MSETSRSKKVGLGLFWGGVALSVAYSIDTFALDGQIMNKGVGLYNTYGPGHDQPAPDVIETPSQTPYPTASAKPKTRRPVIVLDPGHSGPNSAAKDGWTRTKHTLPNGRKFTDATYPKYPEVYEVMDVSKCVGEVLEADKYKVVYTKERANDIVGQLKRVKIAEKVKADLAVSVHVDHELKADELQSVYDQKGIIEGGKRIKLYREDDDGNKIYFSNPKVADKSHEYAGMIKAARSEALGGAEVIYDYAHLEHRNELAPGTAWWVQLLSDRPWVYNEFGAETDGNPKTPMTIDAELSYAEGLVNGIEAAVELPGGLPDSHQTAMNGLRSCLDKRAHDTDLRPVEYQPQ